MSDVLPFHQDYLLVSFGLTYYGKKLADLNKYTVKCSVFS